MGLSVCLSVTLFYKFVKYTFVTSSCISSRITQPCGLVFHKNNILMSVMFEKKVRTKEVIIQTKAGFFKQNLRGVIMAKFSFEKLIDPKAFKQLLNVKSKPTSRIYLPFLKMRLMQKKLGFHLLSTLNNRINGGSIISRGVAKFLEND